MVIFAIFYLSLHLYVIVVKGIIISPEVILQIMDQFEMLHPLILGPDHVQV